MKSITLLLAAISYAVLAIYYQSMQRLPIWSIYYLFAINLISFICYGIDKLAAVKKWQRTPEKHFYALAFFAGWPGSILGQLVFNHKTAKASFRYRFYFMTIMNVAVVFTYLYWEQIVNLPF